MTQVVFAGVADTNYRELYETASRGGGYYDREVLAAQVLEEALDDAHLTKADVDGLIVGPFLKAARSAEIFGVSPNWIGVRDACAAVIEASLVIEAGLARCVALVHATDQRSVAASYGGPAATGQEEHLAYHYYAPWGLTSQGALYAMAARRFLAGHDLDETHLGAIAIAERSFACQNPRALSQTPLSLDAYLSEPTIASPLRRSDYCLVNDGAVAMIVTAGRLETAAERTVQLTGSGTSADYLGASSLKNKLRYYGPAQRKAANMVYRSSGLAPEQFAGAQLYDAFSIHVAMLLIGFGLVQPGDLAEWLETGEHSARGVLPVNTSGGHLADSYLHGWTHVVEAIRQIRGDAPGFGLDSPEHLLVATLGAGHVKALALSRGDA